jgi:iron complex outermembrane recepter protein
MIRPTLSPLASGIAVALLCSPAYSQSTEQSKLSKSESESETTLSTRQPTQQPQATERITVTASAFNRDALSLLQPALVIDAAALRRNQAASLGDVLAGTPGVQSSAFGPGASRPIIRGQDGARVKVLQNGVGTMDVSTISPDHAVATEAHDASQVEVLLGPSTLLYGSGAIGGVVNVVNGRIPTARQSAFNGHLDALSQSADRLRLVSGKLAGGAEQFAWSVDALSRDGKDIKVPELGKLAGSDLEQRSVGAGASWLLPQGGYAGASVQRLESNYGIPTAEGVRIDLKQTRSDVASELANPFSGVARVRVKLANNDYRHAEVEESGEVGTVFKNRATESRLDLTTARFGGLSAVLGLQANQRRFSALGEESIVPLTKSRESALFAVAEHQLPTAAGLLTTEFGVRLERARHRPEAGDDLITAIDGDTDASLIRVERRFNLRSISAAAQFAPSKQLRGTLSLTRSERAPAIEELYSFGPHAATQTFDIGNAQLNKERSTGIDFVLNGEVSALQWRVSLFTSRYRDYVYQSATDVDGDGFADRLNEEGELDADGEFLVQQATQTRARFHGGEISLRYQVTPALALNTFVDHVRASASQRNSDSDSQSRVNLPRLSPSRVGFGVQWQQAAYGASLNVLRVSSAKRLAPLETPTPGYTKLDSELTWRWSGKGSLVYLKGSNLLNKVIRSHTSYLKDVAPQMGRSFGLGVKFAF